MPTLSITRSVVNGTVFTQAQNETQCSDVETWANTTKLDSTNIQTSGVSTNNLADAAVTNAKLATSSVATANIADAAVTGVKLNSNVVDNSSLQLSANQLAVKAGGVTQAMLAARATGTTVAAGGVGVSASCGLYTLASTGTYTAVTNLNVTITTTGRPVFLGLVADGTNSATLLIAPANHNFLAFFQGATQLTEYDYDGTSGSQSLPMFPYHIDFPAAGTYTYTLKAKAPASSISVEYAKLIAFEL